MGSCGLYSTSSYRLVRRETIRHFWGWNIDSQRCQRACPCTPLAANPAGASPLQPRRATASFISNPLPPHLAFSFRTSQPYINPPGQRDGKSGVWYGRLQP